MQNIKPFEDFTSSKINEASVQIAGKTKPSGAKVLASIIVKKLIEDEHLKPGSDKMKPLLTEYIQKIIMDNTY